MSEPQVSVCLTTFSRAHIIGQSIESLLSQELGDFELIISDNASPDETEEVCRKYERLDARVHYFRNERNLGMPANLNAGLKRCRAELVANLHDGDVFRPDLLRKWKEVLEANPDAAFAFCQLDRREGSDRPVPYMRPTLPQRIEKGELARYMLSDRQCYSSPVWGTVMGRRSVYGSVGYFDERFTYYSDVWMWLRLACAYPVMYVQEPLITLTPSEPDRPYNSLNWWHQRVITTMYEDAVDLLHAGDARTVAWERRRLRRIRDGLWIRNIAHALRRGHPKKLAEGLAICRAEDSAVLNIVGIVGQPISWLANAIRREARRE